MGSWFGIFVRLGLCSCFTRGVELKRRLMTFIVRIQAKLKSLKSNCERTRRDAH